MSGILRRTLVSKPADPPECKIFVLSIDQTGFPIYGLPFISFLYHLVPATGLRKAFVRTWKPTFSSSIIKVAQTVWERPTDAGGVKQIGTKIAIGELSQKAWVWLYCECSRQPAQAANTGTSEGLKRALSNADALFSWNLEWFPYDNCWRKETRPV
jgi:hypothetical protein